MVELTVLMLHIVLYKFVDWIDCKQFILRSDWNFGCRWIHSLAHGWILSVFFCEFMGHVCKLHSLFCRKNIWHSALTSAQLINLARNRTKLRSTANPHSSPPQWIITKFVWILSINFAPVSRENHKTHGSTSPINKRICWKCLRGAIVAGRKPTMSTERID